VTLETRLTLSEALGTGIILGMMRLPVRVQTTLMEGKLLANQISRFLESELKIPTYVTVAQQIPPNSPHFMLPTPGVFKAQYAALQLAPPELRAKYAYASAALPYGIFAHAAIEQNWKMSFAALSRAARTLRIGLMRWYGGLRI
jgi:hypothetical protein